jgi:hypothetical protein
MSTARLSSAEKRSAPRHAASGEVRLRRSQAPANWFRGHLEDIASGGFRARHDCFSLCAGELVAFELEGRYGLARAVWTRISGDRAETGFRICE